MTITITNARDLCEAENLLMMAEAAQRHLNYGHDHATRAVRELRRAVAEYKAIFDVQREMFEGVNG